MEPDYLTSGTLIKQIDDEFTKEANSILRPVGLTVSQARILLLLARAPGCELTLKELEPLAHVSQQTCAGNVARLVEKGFLDTSRDREDRRTKHIRLTKKGRNSMEPVRDCMRQAERLVFGSLSEGERRELTRLLRRVRDHMK